MEVIIDGIRYVPEKQMDNYLLTIDNDMDVFVNGEVKEFVNYNINGYDQDLIIDTLYDYRDSLSQRNSPASFQSMLETINEVIKQVRHNDELPSGGIGYGGNHRIELNRVNYHENIIID